MTNNFDDKIDLYPEQNKRLIKKYLLNMVHTTAKFEGVNTTVPQTQRIMAGYGVDNVSIDEIQTIKQLQNGFLEIIQNDNILDFDEMKKINSIVAKYDALFPGQIRNGQSSVMLNDGEEYTPNIPDEKQEKVYFNKIMNSDRTTTDKALTIMLHNIHNQIFWDGNKRSALVTANKILIDGGSGMLYIKSDDQMKWNNLLSDYYRINDNTNIKNWLYENSIMGIPKLKTNNQLKM